MENRRRKRLVDMLSNHQEWMTSKQLAAVLNVSDRTIRFDIKIINEKRKEPLIESNMQKGYKLAADALDYLSQNTPMSVREYTQVPQTSETRCVYIIQKLLFETKELNLVELEEQIHVSGYTINRDIKKIRELLKDDPNLQLIRSGKCISLKGDELSKRRLYKRLLVAEIQKNFLNLDQLAKSYKDFDLLEVKNIFMAVIEEYGYPVREALILILVIHAGTSIERMMHSNYVELMDEEAQELKTSIEYQISSEFFERIAQRFHIQVKESEIIRFASAIVGRKTSRYVSDYIDYHGNWLNSKKLTEEIVDQIYEVFGIDFRQDMDLQIGLKIHLHGLIDREKKHAVLEDIFKDEIQRKYPLVFEMGIFVVEFLEKRMGTRISDTETAYIALHLGAASERMNVGRRYRAVVILPYNQTFSKACETKIADMFRDRMELVETMHYFEEEQIRKQEPDLILTAFPIQHSLNIPTVSINLFVDYDTEANILKALNELDKSAFHLEFVSNIGSLIQKEHYYKNLDCDSPEKIIRLICQKLEQDGAVDSSFCDIVLKREEMSPTSFVDTFAIPHAFGAFAKRSTIAVAQLKNPVQWGEFHVKLVMLFAVNENDQRMIKIFFDWVSSLVNQMDKLAALCVPLEYEQFVDRIME